MLTGRPVDGTHGHGVAFNEDPGRDTVGSHAGHAVDSVFDARTGPAAPLRCMPARSKFALYQRSWAGSLDRTVIEEDNDRLGLAAGRGPCQRARGVHLRAPLRARRRRSRERVHGGGLPPGGARGSTACWAGSATRSRRPRICARANLIVTADHGGRGTHGHSAAPKPDDYRVPFIVDGPPRRPARPVRPQPRLSRPGHRPTAYAGAQPVRNGDLADLATRLLGLPPVPGSVFGARDQLDVR